LSSDRCLRDIIDDVMVGLDMLEREIGRISRSMERKGQIHNMRYWIERVRDLMVEMKLRSEALGDCEQV